MEDCDLPEEYYAYGDIDKYEDQIADDLDALDDLDAEDFPVVKSRTSKQNESINKGKHSNGQADSFKVLSSNSKFTVEEIDDEDFLESLAPRLPKSKRLKIDEQIVGDDDDDDLESFSDPVIQSEPIRIVPSRKYVHRLPPLGKDHITITDTEGRRVFLPIEKASEDIYSAGKPKASNTSLLQIPFENLREIVDAKRHADLIKRANAVRDIDHGNLDDDIFDVNEETEETSDVPEMDTSLWVEKFTPKKFRELLSDDGTNRILLKWLKLWDEFVFGKNQKNKVKRNNFKSSIQEKQNNDNAKKFGKRKQNWDYEEEMIALLAGNPGLGKTTLAHVVAEHAGYNVVEMNASDDRSAELFRNKLETTTQMKSCLGDGNKPNCLIIDEIDGAPLVCPSSEATAPGGHDFIDFSGCSRSVGPTISRKQQMKADMGCLLALCEKSENDIRSCINTLQFMFKKHGELKPEHLQSISIGQKDFQKGLFFIWKSIFQLPKPNRKHFGFLQQLKKDGAGQNTLALSGVQNEFGPSKAQTSNSLRFHNILHLASSNSEFEKMTQGLFDNYLNMKSKDPHLETVVQCASWLQFGDHLEKKIRSQQAFVFMRFYPFLPVAFHMYLARPLAPKLSYSNSAVEFHTRVSHSKQLLEAITSDIKPSVRKNVGNLSSVQDLFPYLYEIIHPTLRPVNVQLYSQSEKNKLLNLILTMISYNLSYNQERNVDGQYTYVLQPNFGELVAFPTLPQHKQLSYASKQLVQREIDLEKMRKIEQALQHLEVDTQGKEKSKQKGQPTAKTVTEMKPIAIKPVKTKPTLDFFGREIVKAKVSESQKQKKASLVNTQVWFKFNEGYSNAVRRTVKLQDFM
eukprot:gene9123-16782_t